MAKAEDFREKKDWDKANEFLDAFKLGFHQDKNIQGDTLSFGRPGLKETRGSKAADKELGLADKLSKKIELDKRNPYRRDISEFTPNWKDDQEELEELLMRAKVQFVNNDLMGATETYRAIETRFSDNYEAKEMLRRISHKPQALEDNGRCTLVFCWRRSASVSIDFDGPRGCRARGHECDRQPFHQSHRWRP